MLGQPSYRASDSQNVKGNPGLVFVLFIVKDDGFSLQI